MTVQLLFPGAKTLPRVDIRSPGLAALFLPRAQIKKLLYEMSDIPEM